MNTAPPPGPYIGFVSNSAWYIYIHRWDVIAYLLDKGYRILIIAPPDREVSAFKHPGITYIPFAFSNKSRSPLAAIDLYRSLLRLYRQYRPLCLFHYAIKANTFGNFAARRAGIPCVSVINGIGYSFLQRNWLYYVVKALYKRTLTIPYEVWFLNNEDGALFIKHKLVEVNKVHILHGEGINTEHFLPTDYAHLPPPPQFTFIIATRLLYSKGIGTLADALEILKNKGVACRCLLLGIADEGHPDSIPPQALQGWVQQGLVEALPFTEDVRPWLAQAHCFVLPSYYNEGLPRCLMEAASMRLPIITTNEKGCKEAITDGVTGLYCRTKDPVDLAEKMETLVLMPEAERQRMGKAGRLLMQQKFSIDRICREYHRILRKLES